MTIEFNTKKDAEKWIKENSSEKYPQSMMIHPDADGTEVIEPLPYEPEPESRKRSIIRE